MELSRDFVEGLSQIFFGGEKGVEDMENPGEGSTTTG